MKTKWNREQFDVVWSDWDPLTTAIVDPKFENDFTILIAEMATEEYTASKPAKPSNKPDSDKYRPLSKNAEDGPEVSYPNISCADYGEKALLEHYAWLLKEGTNNDLKKWNAEVLAAKNNVKELKGKTHKRLIALLLLAQALPHEEGRYAAFVDSALDERQKEILKRLIDLHVSDNKSKKLFQKRSSKELNTCAPIEVTRYRIEQACKRRWSSLFLNLSKDSWADLWKLAVIHWQGDFPKRRPGTTPRRKEE